MKNLYVIGSSHANKIHRLFERKTKFKEKFKIHNLTKPGACFENLFLPDPKIFRADDIIFFQLFGNDIMEKNIRIQKHNFIKTIHLEKFVPKPENEIAAKFESFKNYCAQINCTIIVLDLIPRHIHCCDIHRHRGLMAFQKAVNKKYIEMLKTLKNVSIIRFLYCTTNSYRWMKISANLKSIYTDSVHLKQSYYSLIVEQIIKITLSVIKPISHR